jgi:hypothetical protein
MKEIGKEKREDIMKQYYMEGRPRDDIADMLNVGKGTVTNVARVIEGVIGRTNAEAIRAQAVSRRKAGLKFEDENHGLELVNMTTNSGISWDPAKKQFGAVIAMTTTPRLAATTPEQLANAVADTINIAVGAGVGIPEVPALEQQKVDRIRLLDIQIDERNKSFAQAMRKQEQALKDANMNLSALAEHQKDMKLFGKTGMADRRKAAKIIERMNREYGWDSRRMAEDFSSNESLRRRSSQLEYRIMANKKQMDAYATIDSYHKLVEGVPTELKQIIVSRFNRLSIQEGMPPSMVWIKCLSDINLFYQNLLSLVSLINLKNTEYKNLARSVKVKRAQMSFMDAQYDERIRERAHELDLLTDDIARRRCELIRLDEDLRIKKEHVVTQIQEPKLSTSDAVCVQSGITISYSGSINFQSEATCVGG